MVNILTVEPTKLCCGCKVRKPLSECSVNANGRVRYLCKECNCAKARADYLVNGDRIREYNRQWRKNNKVKLRLIGREWALKKKYGLNFKQLDAMITAQGGCCAVCGEPFTEKGNFRPVVHHDHVTGFTLDILHMSCNSAEGMLRTAARAQRLADYMRKNEPTLFPKHQQDPFATGFVRF